VHAATRTGITAGSCVLIFGAGPIGLVSLLAAKSFGATFVTVCDIQDNRLAVAKELGANLVLRSDSDNFLSQLKELSPPIDVSIECSGFDQPLRLAVKATRAGGKIAPIGRSSKPDQTLPLHEASDKEIDFIGVFRYANIYPKALALVASGKLEGVKRLITHRYNLEQVKEAFEHAESGRDGAIKVMFDI